MKYSLFFLIAIVFISCQTEAERYGKAYQVTRDRSSLEKAIDLIEIGSDTALVRKILGEPIDMGFDFRYLTDEIGENDCIIGAVLHIDDLGKIDDKWVDEICE